MVLAAWSAVKYVGKCRRAEVVVGMQPVDYGILVPNLGNVRLVVEVHFVEKGFDAVFQGNAVGFCHGGVFFYAVLGKDCARGVEGPRNLNRVYYDYCKTDKQKKFYYKTSSLCGGIALLHFLIS